MRDHTCHCGATIPTDRYACLDCARAAAKDLIDTADYLRATDDKRARRRSNFTTGATSRAAETPLPYDPRVRRTLAPIRSALTTWARLIVTEHHCRDAGAEYPSVRGGPTVTSAVLTTATSPRSTDDRRHRPSR